MNWAGGLLGSASAAALCAFMAAPAFAQADPAPHTGTQVPPNQATGPDAGAGTAGGTRTTTGAAASGDIPAQSNGAPVIVVTGIRQSLANAQNIKRNANTVVDAITAQDIGALPDRSVTEALQRIAGISVNRFAGSNDPDHFSVEGSGIAIRGLTFVRSEFNGRDAFSAGVGGQSLNFADVPAELLGSVEVYKNATADLIEGGLAGTVNLNTRKPFDNKGFHIAFDGEANYADFIKRWSPTGSFLISNTWDTDHGRFGLLADFSYSEVKSRADGIQVTNVQTRDGAVVGGADNGGNVCRNPLPASTDTTTLPKAGSPCGASSTPGADGFADLLPNAYAPLGGQFRSQDFDRKRDGQALAAQWQSSDERALVTAQFLRSHTTNSWGEHTFESAPDLSEYDTYPAGCQQNTDSPTGGARAECPVGSLQNYTYASDGLFQKGLITLPGTGWRSASSGSATTTVPTGGIQQSLSRRQVFEENTVKDYGLNFKFNPNDHWAINLDGDYTQAEHNDTDVSVFGSTFADEYLDISGNIPIVKPQKPLTLAASWATPNPTMASESSAQYFQDPNFEFWRAAMDHIEHSTGHEYALAGDVAYKFDNGGFLNRIKFGARYADRDETVRYSAYNWGALSEVWAGTPVSIKQASGPASFFSFPNFFRGMTPGPVGGYYYNGDLINDYGAAQNFFTSVNKMWQAQGGQAGWVPLDQRPGVIAGTPYLPSEIQPVTERDTDAFIMADFGSNAPYDGRVRVSGNFGVRLVNTKVTSGGSIGVPSQQALGIINPYDVRCAAQVPAGAPPGTPASVPGGICNLGPTGYAALQKFATGQTVSNTADNNYTYVLPSLNLKFGVTRDLLFRLAASKVLARPDLADIRNYVTVGTDPNSGAAVATAGNPYLKPATAWQFDATAEYYFARVGYVSFDLFYKDVHNFFYQSLINRDITSNGVTETVQVRGPANYNGHGKIKGFELSYQQSYDFLPGILSGLGVNLNYTFISSSGLPNSFLNTGSPVNPSTITPGNLPLEQLSKHNVNAEIFYEKGRISLRAAYNWRSRFLLTAADVIFPYTSIFNDATGNLDASAFFDVTKHVKIGVQAVNLLNTVTKTLQAYTGNPDVLAPRSYFVNDRRYSFIIRGNF